MTARIGVQVQISTRHIAATGVVAAATALLAGCSGDTPRATPPTPTVTVTSTASGSTTAPAVTSTSAAGATASGIADTSARSGCSPDIGLTAAGSRDMVRITQPERGSWRAYNAGGTWRPGMSWVELTSTATQAPIRPHQLLIYQDGYFQGTGIRCDARYGQYVAATAPDAITVQYSYLDPTNPEQQRSQGGVGRAVVTFRWNGSRVVMDGSLPYAFTKGQC
ncbi:LppP/LprE family lipoprotein [uncultured Williamsia sp.]|uniref:LppP/LprE family lipoprotein n=1 Tax=uncultured Williamsia sp. TaxID=259311 RepID=UPI00261DEAFD|nr:LppP/LprE family lipoprotein [uncultured Williamsia sp.]